MLEFVDDVPDPGALNDEVWVEETAFFPSDLPTLGKDSFGWTPKELKDAARLANRWLNEEPLTMWFAA